MLYISVQQSDTTTNILEKKTKLKEFIEHRTTSRKYYLLIKKCGSGDCTIFKPLELDPAIYSTIHSIPGMEVCSFNAYLNLCTVRILLIK